MPVRDLVVCLLAIGLLCGLAGCGQKPASKEPSTTAPAGNGDPAAEPDDLPSDP